MPENPIRVVVLGARGFIGSTLLSALARAGVPTLAPSSVELDLMVEGASDRLAAMLRRSDSLVMLAALTPDKGRGVTPFLKNLHIAANVYTALEKTTPAHIVYVGSDAVYPAEVGRVTEESCARPPDLYGMMHLAREAMFKMFTKVSVAVLRSTLVYGSGDTHNSYGPNRFRRMAQKEGRITLFGEGEEKRDHILVDDVAALMLLVLRHASSGTLNVATGQSVSYAELAKQVAALFDKPIEIISMRRQNPITHRHFDVIAIRKAFPGFTFTPLEAGLAKAHREMLEGH